MQGASALAPASKWFEGILPLQVLLAKCRTPSQAREAPKLKNPP